MSQITTQEQANQNLGLFFKCGACEKRKFVKSIEGIAMKIKSNKEYLICFDCYWFGGQNNPGSQWIQGIHHIKPKNQWLQIIRSCGLMEGWMYDGFLFGFCVDENNKVIPNSGVEQISRVKRQEMEVFV